VEFPEIVVAQMLTAICRAANSPLAESDATLESSFEAIEVAYIRSAHRPDVVCSFQRSPWDNAGTSYQDLIPGGKVAERRRVGGQWGVRGTPSQRTKWSRIAMLGVNGTANWDEDVPGGSRHLIA
jgi:hypothetical protein